MINVNNVSLTIGGRKLFDEVNLKLTNGNTYGVIGANGAGKSTFLKILSGKVDSSTGTTSMGANERMAVLEQDHYKYDEVEVLKTVIMGHQKLYDIMTEKDALYMKPDFSEEDGLRAADLEGEFAELDGWDAEPNAEKLLMGLGIEKDLHYKLMKELTGGEKVKVLLAQALFGNPDNLLLDEPTNHLDFKAISWLEEFLMNYENTVLVVSHDRHFLNKVCTHMLDIDRSKIKLFVGNYDFWKQSSELIIKLQKDQNKKAEERKKELENFIARFSANASKSKQATSRKKLLDKIVVDDIEPSTRRYPFVGFTPDREAGKDILTVEGISKTIDGVKVLDNVSFTINKGDKTVILSKNEIARTTLLQILMGEVEADEGTFKWGVTTTQAYIPKDNSSFFKDNDLSLVEWLRQFSKPENQDEPFLRSFLGRMLFSGEEPLKQVKVLSGGEKVRCMFSKAMLSGANVLLLDEPTNHLDLESISSVNDGLVAFKGTLLFTSHDHNMISSIANRVIELTPGTTFDREMDFDEFLEDESIQNKISDLYKSAL
jgi:ATPase subunit of ABC transporter with duplicated ATPase domains